MEKHELVEVLENAMAQLDYLFIHLTEKQKRLRFPTTSITKDSLIKAIQALEK